MQSARNRQDKPLLGSLFLQRDIYRRISVRRNRREERGVKREEEEEEEQSARGEPGHFRRGSVCERESMKTVMR